MRFHAGRSALAATVAALLAACTTSGTGEPGDASAPGGRLTVLAAASLTESFDEIAAGFGSEHPGVDVEVSYASSATVVQQANRGAPADVIALAGDSAAEALDPALVVDRTVFATNVLAIATPADDPGDVSGLADLARPGLNVVLCVETAPCGRAADVMLAAAGVEASVVSREIDVKATLAKVALGEADAAVVYRSDVVSAGDRVRGVTVPDAVNQTLHYPALRVSDNPLAGDFLASLTAPATRETLRDHGFGGP